MLKFFLEKLLNWLEISDFLDEIAPATQSIIHLKDHLRRYVLLERNRHNKDEMLALLEWFRDTASFVEKMQTFWTNDTLGLYHAPLTYWRHAGPIFDQYASKQSDDRPFVRILVEKEDPDIPGLVFHGHSDSVIDIAFSPDGRHITSCSSDSTIRIWDTSSGLQQAEFKLRSVQSIAYLSGGKSLVVAAWGSRIYRLNLEDKSSGLLEIPVDAKLTRCSIRVSPNDDFVLCGTESGELITVNLHTNTIQGRLQAHTEEVTNVEISADGTIFISESRDGPAYMWRENPDFSDSQPLHIFSCKESNSHSHGVLLLPKSRILISSCPQPGLYNAYNGEFATYLGEVEARRLCTLSNDGRYLVTTRGSLLQLKDGQIERVISNLEEAVPTDISRYAFSRDGRILAAVSREKIYTWKIEDILANEKHESSLHKGESCWAFSEDRQRAVQILDFEDSGGFLHQGVTIWDLIEGRMLADSRRIRQGPTIGAKFFPSGRYLVCVGEGFIDLCDGISGKLIKNEAYPPAPYRYPPRLIISPCETIIAVLRGDVEEGGDEGKIVWENMTFWRVEGRQQLTQMSTVALSPPLRHSWAEEMKFVVGFDSHGRCFRLNDMIWDVPEQPPSQLSHNEAKARLQGWLAPPPSRLRHEPWQGLQFGDPALEYYSPPFHWGDVTPHIEGDLVVWHDKEGQFVVLDFSHMEVPVRSPETAKEIEMEAEKFCVIG